MFVGIGSNPADELCLSYHRIYFRLRKSSHPRAVRTAEIVRLYAKEAGRIARYGRAVIENWRTDLDAEFLGGSDQASAPQRMPLKPQNDREMKGLEGSNPLFSAGQSSIFCIVRREKHRRTPLPARSVSYRNDTPASAAGRTAHKTFAPRDFLSRNSGSGFHALNSRRALARFSTGVSKPSPNHP